MTQERFQELVLHKFDRIEELLRKNEEDHGRLDTKIESVRTEVESVRTEVSKSFNSQLRWTIGIMLGFGIKIAGLVFLIVKYVTPAT